jgi:hypothetical protein
MSIARSTPLQVTPIGQRGRCYPRVSIDELELRILNSLAAFTEMTSPGEPGTPVVLVTRERGSRGSVRFYCSWCRRDHYHGSCDGCGCELHVSRLRLLPCTCPIGAGNGLRGPHCPDRQTPYRRCGGYYVREVAA